MFTDRENLRSNIADNSHFQEKARTELVKTKMASPWLARWRVFSDHGRGFGMSDFRESTKNMRAILPFGKTAT